ncbi:hypothetical protein TNCV_638591 [Trichonephila clavipes]|nr:hypothetical protein TNCV_638591 [Trichonephila clavipes]
MGKLPDFDTFDCKQIVDVRRMNHSISEIVRQLGFSRTTVSGAYQEYLDGGQKLVIGVPGPSTYKSTFAQCSSSGFMSCLGKRAQKLSVEDWKHLARSDESRF